MKPSGSSLPSIWSISHFPTNFPTNYLSKPLIRNLIFEGSAVAWSADIADGDGQGETCEDGGGERRGRGFRSDAETLGDWACVNELTHVETAVVAIIMWYSTLEIILQLLYLFQVIARCIYLTYFRSPLEHSSWVVQVIYRNVAVRGPSQGHTLGRGIQTFPTQTVLQECLNCQTPILPQLALALQII